MSYTIASFVLLVCAYEYILPVEGISRTEVLKRAKFWMDKRVPYSMDAFTGDPRRKNYRTDCSGYVSMAWKLSSSRTTATLPEVSKKINKNDLQAGDILLMKPKDSKSGIGHVVIFEKWANSGKTKYWGYEQTPPHTKHRIITYPYFPGYGTYAPYRYKEISGGGGVCKCCKAKGLRNYCGHELCGSGCNANDIYACSAKGADAQRYGPCRKGCAGSSTESACRK